ncbi:MAG: hypothetical protein B7X51_14800 [Pseudomonas sp. 34-62-33]|nr:MAG: hypothetical protein B7X51_14800 [Pseudomonas sp. 34-62-33]
MTKIHPAIAGHVMEENEKLRGLLTQALEFTEANTCGGTDVAQLIAEMRAALPRKAEPDHVEDMRAMVEPAPAQDEREVAAVIGFYEGEREPRLLSWNVLPNGEHRLYTRPARTLDSARPPNPCGAGKGRTFRRVACPHQADRPG